MSSPEDISVKRQAKRHRGPLVGMAVVVAAIAIYFVWWLAYEVDNAETPDDPATVETGERAPADDGEPAN
mgnify:FL=1